MVGLLLRGKMVLVGNKTEDGKEISKLSAGSDKRVTVRCDNCGSVNTTTYNNYTRAQVKRNWSGVTYCKSCAGSMFGLKKARAKGPWNKGNFLSPQKRKAAPYISADGYMMVYDPTRCKKGKPKWSWFVKEHIKVMEDFLDRKLKKNEKVHHIDGAKLNNDINNLYLCKSHKQHRNAHVSLMEIAYDLVRQGRIVFDNKTGTYKEAL